MSEMEVFVLESAEVSVTMPEGEDKPLEDRN